MSTGLTFGNAVPVLLYLGWLGLTLTALGYLIAWPLDSTHGFHAIMSVFLLPMWLLSGAFFPAEGAGWIGWIIRANPLTYGVAGLRRLMVTDTTAVANLPSLPVCLAVTGLFGLVCIATAVALTNRRSAHNAR
jgi:ABC-2 type transport system permease protein